jgi:DNA-binding transcriptional LysR family regulator
MELRQLRYFVEAARHLNFTRAAQTLRVAQPALSRQIRNLEEELGVRLLERDQHHVQLTEAGRTFLAQAEVVLDQSRTAMETARAQSAKAAQRLRIGYVWGLFHTLAPERVRAFRQTMPEVSVNLLDLSATEQAGALRRGSLDAGFIGLADEADAGGLEKRQVATTRFVAVLPAEHPQARRRRVDLRALRDDLFLAIAEEAFPGALRVMMDACRRAGPHLAGPGRSERRRRPPAGVAPRAAA